MRTLNQKISKPTKNKIRKLIRQCDRMQCEAVNLGEKHWNCNECKVNRRYKDYVGIGLNESVEYSEVMSEPTWK